MMLEQTAPVPDYWRCAHCGCLWRDNHDGTVSLAGWNSRSCPTCEMDTNLACQPLYSHEMTIEKVSLPWKDYQRLATLAYERALEAHLEAVICGPRAGHDPGHDGEDDERMGMATCPHQDCALTYHHSAEPIDK